MKKITSFIVLLLLIIPNDIFAQVNISGVITDIDTQKPLSCSQVNIYCNELDTNTYTNQDGYFELNNLPTGDYCISVGRDNYHYYDTCFVEYIIDKYNTINVQLYSYDSPNYRITDVAKQDVFDLGFAFNFYSPSLGNSDNNFDKNMSLQLYNLDFHFKLANKLQMGFKIIPIEMSWNRFNNPDSLYIKERYFGASGGISTYFRFIPSTIKKSGARGFFIDFGASYSLPYYYAYSNFTDKYNKTTTRHIKNYFNDIQAMVRVGFTWWSINANYRFNDVLIHGYEETPKLTLGIELLIPMSN